MSSLDDRLREVLHELAGSFYYEGTEKQWFDEEIVEWTTKIKQAFADEGYHSPKGPMVQSHVEMMNKYVKNQLMTGKEWLQKFEEELDSIVVDDKVLAGVSVMREYALLEEAADLTYKTIRKAILEAAKKAAGITNE